MPTLDALSTRAIHAATSVLELLGIRCTGTKVLRNSSNTTILIQPASIVAKVTTTTGQVWAHVKDRLQREIALAIYLKEKGLPVISPANMISPEPHETGGLHMTFWQYVEPENTDRPNPEHLAPHLSDLHIALKSYPQPLPFMSPALTETKMALNYLTRLEVFQAKDLDFINQVWAETETALKKLSDTIQPLHGDAHPGNVIYSKGQFIWTDFEDCCSGLIAWDLACLTQSTQDNIEPILTAYGLPVDATELELCQKARHLQGVAWTACLAHRFPDRRNEALTYFNKWRASINS